MQVDKHSLNNESGREISNQLLEEVFFQTISHEIDILNIFDGVVKGLHFTMRNQYE